jgi:hypothetical protein
MSDPRPSYVLEINVIPVKVELLLCFVLFQDGFCT